MNRTGKKLTDPCADCGRPGRIVEGSAYCFDHYCEYKKIKVISFDELDKNFPITGEMTDGVRAYNKIRREGALEGFEQFRKNYEGAC